jgi:hypothetical protein
VSHFADCQHADVVIKRPKTKEGRKMKPQYNKVLSEYPKHTDKFYLNNARKWLLARVKYNSVAVAARELNLSEDNFRKDLFEKNWDEIMGYSKD